MNTCELIGHYGSDEIHALSAWTSTERSLDDKKRDRIPKLLKDLADNGHHTPFEKSSLHFLVTVEQASHVHILKHRSGVSANGESARYKELKEDKMYLPEDWKGVPVSEWQGASPLILDWCTTLKVFSEASNELYHRCLADLAPIIGRKRAKESARFFKMMNSQITMDLMFNWRSFNHFLKLRRNPDAQLEIRELADSMLNLVRDIPGNPFEHTIKAFGYERI